MTRTKQISEKEKALLAKKQLSSAKGAGKAAAGANKILKKHKKPKKSPEIKLDEENLRSKKRDRSSDFSMSDAASVDSATAHKSKKSSSKLTKKDKKALGDALSPKSKIEGDGLSMDWDGEDEAKDTAAGSSVIAGDASVSRGVVEEERLHADSLSHASGPHARHGLGFFTPSLMKGLKTSAELAQYKALVPALVAALSGSNAKLFRPHLEQLGIAMDSVDDEDNDEDEDGDEEDGVADDIEEDGDEEEEVKPATTITATFSSDAEDDGDHMDVEDDDIIDSSPAVIKSIKRRNKKSRLDSDESSDEELDYGTVVTANPTSTSTQSYINIRNNMKVPSLPVLTQAACLAFIDDLRKYRVDFPQVEIKQFMPQLVRDRLDFFANNEGRWPQDWALGTPEQLQERIMQAIIVMRLDPTALATGTAGPDLGGQLQTVKFSFDGMSMDPVFQFQQRLKTIMVSHADTWQRASAGQRRNLLKEFIKTAFTGQGVVAHKHPVYYLGKVVLDRVETKKDIDSFDQVSELLLRKCMKIIANNNNLATKGMMAIPIATWEKFSAMSAASSQTKQPNQGNGGGGKSQRERKQQASTDRPQHTSNKAERRTIGFTNGYPHLRCGSEHVLLQDIGLLSETEKAIPSNECFACGRRHGGVCRDAASPHANTDSTKRWIFSDPAIALHIANKKLVHNIPPRNGSGGSATATNNNSAEKTRTQTYKNGGNKGK